MLGFGRVLAIIFKDGEVCAQKTPVLWKNIDASAGEVKTVIESWSSRFSFYSLLVVSVFCFQIFNKEIATNDQLSLLPSATNYFFLHNTGYITIKLGFAKKLHRCKKRIFICFLSSCWVVSSYTVGFGFQQRRIAISVCALCLPPSLYDLCSVYPLLFSGWPKFLSANWFVSLCLTLCFSTLTAWSWNLLAKSECS